MFVTAVEYPAASRLRRSNVFNNSSPRLTMLSKSSASDVFFSLSRNIVACASMDDKQLFIEATYLH